MEMGAVQNIIAFSDPLAEFVLLVLTTLCSTDLGDLSFYQEINMTPLNWRFRWPPSHFGFL